MCCACVSVKLEHHYNYTECECTCIQYTHRQKISVELTMWGEPKRVPIIYFYYCDIALATGKYHHNKYCSVAREIALWLGQ